MAKEPELNGQKPEKIGLSIAPFELDKTDAVHVQLAQQLERDGILVVNVTGKVDATSWRVKKTDEGDVLAVSYRFLATDVTPAA